MSTDGLFEVYEQPRFTKNQDVEVQTMAGYRDAVFLRYEEHDGFPMARVRFSNAEEAVVNIARLTRHGY